MECVNEMFGFIKASPTSFHAVNSIRQMLERTGFESLDEYAPWRLLSGRRYYMTRNQSSIIAFRLPEAGLSHFQIVASHSDSPAFKLKPAAGKSVAGYAVLNVEKYGGMIMSTWFDRPLSIAGRVIVKTPSGMKARLVNIDRDLAVIPSMPIHFNREVNDGVKLNPQIDMLPVYGRSDSDYIDIVAEALSVDRESIAGCDLFLVNRDAPKVWGDRGEYILSPRLDDLECAYSSIRALIDAKPGKHVDMACILDNEEVGSSTRQGADSTMLADVLHRIARAVNAPEIEATIARSFMVSADNAHAVHPNHPEKYDEGNRVVMNGGIVVKFNASQKYTTDGLSQAVFESICSRGGVPVQRFANRSDIPGGSTLGNIANRHASMSTVDIGLAQLAMHSANESAGKHDLQYMIDGLRIFFESNIQFAGDSVVIG